MSLSTRALAALMAAGLIVAPLSVQAQSSPFDPQSQRANIQQWADRLASELEHLLEDVSIDLNRPQQRDIYHDVDKLLREVSHFQKTARSNASAEHLYRDFQSTDRQIHDLIQRVQAVGGERGATSRNVARIRYADQQLHYAMSRGNLSPDSPPDRWKDVVSRQAHILESESQRLLQAARYALREDRRGQQIEALIGQFTQEATHLHGAAEKANDREHIRRDYSDLRRSWQQVVNAMNTLTRNEHYYLRSQSMRVDSVMNNLHQALMVEGKYPRYFD